MFHPICHCCVARRNGITELHNNCAPDAIAWMKRCPYKVGTIVENTVNIYFVLTIALLQN